MSQLSGYEILKKQYGTSENFRARVELNRRFASNQHGWMKWVFEQIKFPPAAKVLELGCGPALLWKANLDKVPNDTSIILSDFSPGMLDDAQKNLNRQMFEFQVIDAHQIPHVNQSFDIIIANNMLYHIPEPKIAISEIGRVLKNDGVFYAATFGNTHMKELSDLMLAYNPRLNYSLSHLAQKFGLENGLEQLQPFFKNISLLRYKDSLRVTEAGPLINYILSLKASGIIELLNSGKLSDLEKHIEMILEKDGYINISKDAGMFIARK